MEIKVENFSRSNLIEWIKDCNHRDKVKCAIYSAELVIDIYERNNNNSKAHRLAIEAAKAWVESPTEYNRKAACAAADRADAIRIALPNSYVVFAAAAAAISASAAAEAAAACAASNYVDPESNADDEAAFFAARAAACAASAAVYADRAGGENVKAKIISWFRKNDKKNRLRSITTHIK